MGFMVGLVVCKTTTQKVQHRRLLLSGRKKVYFREMKSDRITAKTILNYLPDSVFEELSKELLVDYKSKKLTGKMLFKLLLYGLLSENELSLRVLEGVYENNYFQNYSGLSGSIDHSSIGERLGKIDYKYFEKLFKSSYELFSKHNPKERIGNYELVRFDSTIVNLSSKLIKIPYLRASNPSKLKDKVDVEFKFTVGFNGLLVKEARFFNQASYSNEDIALAEVIKAYGLSAEEVAVFDRGLQARSTLEGFNKESIKFVTRAKKDCRYKKVRTITDINKSLETDTLLIEEDLEVHLYDRYSHITKNTFRLIKGVIKQSNEPIYFLTNLFENSLDDITLMYRRRWDIELFFKMLKQHFSFKHLLARNENGIKIMLFMALIAIMMVFVYQELNKTQTFKLAKRKFNNELETEWLEEIVRVCGGDFSLFKKEKIP